MKSYKLLILLLLFCWGDATSLAAQERFPFVVSGGVHSLTVPWHLGPVTKRLNPVLIVGTEHTLKPGNRFRLYLTANLGYFRHYWWMTGVFIDTELGISYMFLHGFHTDLRLGVGYLHYFWRRKTLELRDGEYVQATNWGKPAVLVPLSIVLGYHGISARSLTLSPFFSAQWALQAPFADEVPAMTHLFLLFGVRINWGNAKPNAGE
ncbi:MAG: hypothetical protein JSU64_06500 [candidate division WOR-3 bacterium]|nr:MAG: hypothetical protein JSU64_06500 [candidate division WOR-3 bacterium]UCF04966.1 MAG: hypothetical protein JSV33_13745 [bacterium]